MATTTKQTVCLDATSFTTNDYSFIHECRGGRESFPAGVHGSLAPFLGLHCPLCVISTLVLLKTPSVDVSVGEVPDLCKYWQVLKVCFFRYWKGIVSSFYCSWSQTHGSVAVGVSGGPLLLQSKKCHSGLAKPGATRRCR